MAMSNDRGVKPLLRVANIPCLCVCAQAEAMSYCFLVQEAPYSSVREGHAVFVTGFNDVRGPQ